LIKDGEFQKIENFDWQKRGYAFSHGHSISPFIKDVLDIETIHGKVYVCGNSSKIYVSNNSGYSWDEEIDLAEIGEIFPTPAKVQIMSTDGKDILFGSDTGSIVYHSTLIPSVIVPLEKPV